MGTTEFGPLPLSAGCRCGRTHGRSDLGDLVRSTRAGARRASGLAARAPFAGSATSAGLGLGGPLRDHRWRCCDAPHRRAPRPARWRGRAAGQGFRAPSRRRRATCLLPPPDRRDGSGPLVAGTGTAAGGALGRVHRGGLCGRAGGRAAPEGSGRGTGDPVRQLLHQDGGGPMGPRRLVRPISLARHVRHARLHCDPQAGGRGRLGAARHSTSSPRSRRATTTSRATNRWPWTSRSGPTGSSTTPSTRRAHPMSAAASGRR